MSWPNLIYKHLGYTVSHMSKYMLFTVLVQPVRGALKLITGYNTNTNRAFAWIISYSSDTHKITCGYNDSRD